jgi:hypothetical protein
MVADTDVDCGTQVGRLKLAGDGLPLPMALTFGLNEAVGKAAPPPLIRQLLSVVVAAGPLPLPPPALLTAIGLALPLLA